MITTKKADMLPSLKLDATCLCSHIGKINVVAKIILFKKISTQFNILFNILLPVVMTVDPTG
jgi:hypothetical protein